MQRKKTIIISLIVVSFVLLIASVLFYLETSRQERQIDPLEIEAMTKDQIVQYIYDKQAEGHTPFYYFIPIFAFFGIAVGTLIYYIMNEGLERKDETIRQNTGVILKLLQPDERRAMERIIANGGKAQQAEITYLEGFTKVKAHRTVEALVRKGVLRKEKMGKMRLITMDEEVYEAVKKR